MGNPDVERADVRSATKGAEVDRVRSTGEEPGSYVTFRASGEATKGEFHCSECGYGVTVYRALPVCPMCGGTAWEQVPWSPLTRALDGGPTESATL
jgi:rubredoxin